MAAHDLGPRHPEALRALRGVDRSIARFARVLRRLPEHGYDLFVLSDHGQIRSVPFRDVAGGASVAEAIVGCFGPEREAAAGSASPAAPAPPMRPMGPESDVDPPLPLWPFTGSVAAVPRRHRAAGARAERRVGRRPLRRAGRAQRERVPDPHDGARAGGGDRGPLPRRALAPVPARRHRLRPRAGCPGTPVLLSRRGAPDPPAVRPHGLSRVRPTRSRHRRARLAGPPRHAVERRRHPVRALHGRGLRELPRRAGEPRRPVRGRAVRVPGGAARRRVRLPRR